jgi:hypothetical protein
VQVTVGVVVDGVIGHTDGDGGTLGRGSCNSDRSEGSEDGCNSEELHDDDNQREVERKRRCNWLWRKRSKRESQASDADPLAAFPHWLIYVSGLYS